MYGLPKDFSPNLFVGVEIIQICFSSNKLTLHFGDELGISIESAFYFKRFGTDTKARLIDFPICSSDLMSVIGDHVVQALSQVAR